MTESDVKIERHRGCRGHNRVRWIDVQDTRPPSVLTMTKWLRHGYSLTHVLVADRNGNVSVH